LSENCPVEQYHGHVPGDVQAGGLASVVPSASAKGVCSLPSTIAVTRQA
jgi:hypothetical protein